MPKPNRRSIRLPGYDYARAGWYFVTICCHQRRPIFGEIVGAYRIRPESDQQPVMKLNDAGIIVQNEWLKTEEIRPEVILGEFIIMPNHIHGIIGLSGQDSGPNSNSKSSIFTGKSDIRGESASDSSGEQNSNAIFENTDVCDPGVFDKGVCDTPLRSPSKTIGSIIRGFKSSVTKQLVSIGIESPIWQRNFYEHIIRNEDAHRRISDYIQNNPAQWQADDYFNANS